MIPPMSLVKNQVLENIIVNKLIYVMLQFATIILIQGNQGQIDPIIPCHTDGVATQRKMVESEYTFGT